MHCVHELAAPDLASPAFRLRPWRIPASAKNRRISDAVYSRTCPMWPTVRSLPYSRIGSNAKSAAECKADNIAESVQVWGREIEQAIRLQHSSHFFQRKERIHPQMLERCTKRDRSDRMVLKGQRLAFDIAHDDSATNTRELSPARAAGRDRPS